MHQDLKCTAESICIDFPFGAAGENKLRVIRLTAEAAVLGGRNRRRQMFHCDVQLMHAFISK